MGRNEVTIPYRESSDKPLEILPKAGLIRAHVHNYPGWWRRRWHRIDFYDKWRCSCGEVFVFLDPTQPNDELRSFFGKWVKTK